MKKYLGVSLIICCVILLVTGCKAKKVEEVTDQEKIAIEYTVSKNNPFQYASLEEVETLLEKEGILYFGYPESDRSQELVEILIAATKKLPIAVHYYNPRTLMKEPKKYDQLLEKLGAKELAIPSVYIIKDKQIVAIEDSLAHLEVDTYLTKKEKQQLQEKYQAYFEKYFIQPKN